MKVFIILALISFATTSFAGELGTIKNTSSCISFLKKYAKNERRHRKLALKSIQFICSTSNKSAQTLQDAAACTYNLYARDWKNKKRKTVSSPADSTIYACAYANGNRNTCVVEGKEAGAVSKDISTICNPFKSYAMDEILKL